MSSSSSSSTAPFTIPAKAPPAQAVLTTLSPPSCTNSCHKENCTVHVLEEVDDKKELTEIMGRLSLGDISNKKSSSGFHQTPGNSDAGPIARPLSKSLVRRPKVKFHFVRHAQAIHNMSSITDARHLRDTCLTPHGISQATSLSKTFPYASSPKIKYILSSPLRRTIDTAIYGFPSLTSSGIPITLWPDIREFGRWQCNTGTALWKLRQGIKRVEEISNSKLKIDTKLMYGGWEWNFEMGMAKKMERVERVKKALKGLEQVVVEGGEWNGMMFEPSYGEDVGIVVVSHGGFLKWLMGYSSQRWYNAEVRTFKFPSPSKIAAGHAPLQLFQTKASIAKPHVPIAENGPPFHMVIDNTTKERLAEIQEYMNHVESIERAAWKGRARIFQHHLQEEEAEAEENLIG